MPKPQDWVDQAIGMRMRGSGGVERVVQLPAKKITLDVTGAGNPAQLAQLAQQIQQQLQAQFTSNDADVKVKCEFVKVVGPGGARDVINVVIARPEKTVSDRVLGIADTVLTGYKVAPPTADDAGKAADMSVSQMFAEPATVPHGRPFVPLAATSRQTPAASSQSTELPHGVKVNLQYNEISKEYELLINAGDLQILPALALREAIYTNLQRNFPGITIRNPMMDAVKLPILAIKFNCDPATAKNITDSLNQYKTDGSLAKLINEANIPPTSPLRRAM